MNTANLFSRMAIAALVCVAGCLPNQGADGVIAPGPAGGGGGQGGVNIQICNRANSTGECNQSAVNTNVGQAQVEGGGVGGGKDGGSGAFTPPGFPPKPTSFAEPPPDFAASSDVATLRRWPEGVYLDITLVPGKKLAVTGASLQSITVRGTSLCALHGVSEVGATTEDQELFHSPCAATIQGEGLDALMSAGKLAFTVPPLSNMAIGVSVPVTVFVGEAFLAEFRDGESQYNDAMFSANIRADALLHLNAPAMIEPNLALPRKYFEALSMRLAGSTEVAVNDRAVFDDYQRVLNTHLVSRGHTLIDEEANDAELVGFATKSDSGPPDPPENELSSGSPQ